MPDGPKPQLSTSLPTAGSNAPPDSFAISIPARSTVIRSVGRDTLWPMRDRLNRLMSDPVSQLLIWAMMRASTSLIASSQPAGASAIRADQLVPIVGPEKCVTCARRCRPVKSSGDRSLGMTMRTPVRARALPASLHRMHGAAADRQALGASGPPNRPHPWLRRLHGCFRCWHSANTCPAVAR